MGLFGRQGCRLCPALLALHTTAKSLLNKTLQIVPFHATYVAYVFSLSRLPNAGSPDRGFLLYHANVVSLWRVAIG